MRHRHLPTLTTERLLLRPFALTDAESVRTLAGRYEVSRHTSNIQHPYEEGMAERWIAVHAHQFYTHQHVTLAITDQVSGDMLGAVSFDTHLAHKRAELGYWIGLPYWGNGYCTEAVCALIDYGFEVLDLHKIVARHFVSNPASGRVMQKAGMQHEAVLRDDILKEGVYHDMAVYGVINPRHVVAPAS